MAVSVAAGRVLGDSSSSSPSRTCLGNGSQKDQRISSARLEPFDAAVGFVGQVGCRLGQFKIQFDAGPSLRGMPPARRPLRFVLESPWILRTCLLPLPKGDRRFYTIQSASTVWLSSFPSIGGIRRSILSCQ